VTALRQALRRCDTAPLDVLVALTIFALLAVECASNSGSQHPWVDLAWFVPFCAALAWLRTRTLAATAVILAATVGMTFTGDNIVDFTTAFIAVMLVSFAAGFALELGRAVACLMAIIAVVVLVNVAGAGDNVGDYLFPPAIFATWWTLGRFLRARDKLTRELRTRTERLERERDELARAASDEERARVARELHDVVAHSMSVMVVQAGAARRVLDRSPEQSIAALRTVELTGRETLEELRWLLGVLRPSGQQAELQPSPRLDDIDALVTRARSVGLKVDLRITGERPELPATTDLTIYRIVQEALTNSLKHAGDTHASVEVRCTPDNVVIDVRDTGAANGRSSVTSRAAGRDGAGGDEGFGLIGMRERVELLGGEFDAGPAHGGGFRVYARIPLEPVAEPSAAAKEILPT
jgi:signal transduction histidine kinase